MLKDDRLKRPGSAYWCFLSDKREEIIQTLKKEESASNQANVAKKAGEMWKNLTETDRKMYEEQAAERKKDRSVDGFGSQ